MVITCVMIGCADKNTLHHHEHEEAHAHEEAHEHGPHTHADEAAKQHHAHEHEGEHEEEEAHAGEIRVDKTHADAAGLQVARIEPSDFTGVIKVGGRILAAQGAESVVVATVSGIVDLKKNPFVEGVAVHKGQPLLDLVSDHLSEGNIAVRIKNAYEAARREYERKKELVENQIVSQREFEQAQLEYEQAKVAWEAVAGKQTGKGVSVVAPMNGFLKEIRVQAGDFVTVGQPLAVISQSNRLTLKADVPEKYYHQLATIRSANFRTPYADCVYELSHLNGRLLSYGKNSDPLSSYIPVTFEFDQKGALLPGAFVEIFLLTVPIPNVISLPVSALVEEQGNFSVFVRVHEDAYKKVPVRIGMNNGSAVQILQGIHPGDEVVTEGAYQVKLAAATSAIPAHSHNH